MELTMQLRKAIENSDSVIYFEHGDRPLTRLKILHHMIGVILSNMEKELKEGVED